ncbi:hypothetical protein PR048_009442 [Dryococelus australis]|uniref:Uncharacterized protein n=1 Tax=Dryococelus australis TaxID=614101 RepID=A0ABQ9HZW3_9NEOP|nr:hypothetical protein PR048_009442 [Dryococelus australis]
MNHSKYTDTIFNATKSGVDTMDLKCANYSKSANQEMAPSICLLHYFNNLCKLRHNTHSCIWNLLANSPIKKHMTQRLQIPNFAIGNKENNNRYFPGLRTGRMEKNR